jgi:phosphomethylpyrimidine synthase
MAFGDIAKSEGVGVSRLRRLVRGGRVVVLDNPRRINRPLAIGEGVSTKVNANIGVSPDEGSIKGEILKAKAAVKAGADTIMDLSVGPDARKCLKRMLKSVDVPVGTVPIYNVFPKIKLDFTIEDYLREVESQARSGVDFMTIHAGLTMDVVKKARTRTIPITSRGGCFLAAWMSQNKAENPLYAAFDEILEILNSYDVTVSLGDGARPGCIEDATDKAQIAELKVLGRLTRRCLDRGVKVIVEGPGHVPLDQIERNMRIQKRICHNVPFYVLGPLTTDIGAGYDHITGAIGGALAAVYGADFLCYLTPTEHLGLPGPDDVYEGVMASKIAAHSADIVKLKKTSRDYEMGRARKKLDWDRMYELALDPNLRKKHRKPVKGRECTMCGEFCALKVY